MLLYLIFSCVLFLIGFFGLFLVRKHLIMILLSIELALLAITINFIMFSVYLDDLVGQLYALLLLTLAAAESSLGLAILVVFYRLKGGISIDLIALLKS